MQATFDQKKNDENLKKHGLRFEEAIGFEWATAITKRDDRYNYGETRLISYGMCNDRLHCIVWTVRDTSMRLISFRKANPRERKQYEQDQTA